MRVVRTNDTWPLYQSKTKVRALKIASVEFAEDGLAEITPVDEGYASFEASPSWEMQYNGGSHDYGYFVLHEDGFESWLPTEEFEEGYTQAVWLAWESL